MPFSAVPGQSKLFLQYQTSPASLREFYPNAPQSIEDICSYAEKVLKNYTTDRNRLCNALAEMNQRFGAGAETISNIDLLRDEKTVAVLTGQQTGLFTGPLYTIYKALSAIKLAEELCKRGVKAVPIFWAATEDHDLAEVSEAFVIDVNNKLANIVNDPKPEISGRSVGDITLTENIESTINELFENLPQSEFSIDLKQKITQQWKTGSGFGEAFLKELTGLLGRFGLIMSDPLDPELKELAKPVYRSAIEHSSDIVASIIERDEELKSQGFHSQVLVEKDHVTLFYHDDDGRRLSIKRSDNETFTVPDLRKTFTVDELVQIADEEPRRLSPGVMLRPVVQDFLFPTVCYFGGGAEIAYFAQNSVVYHTLERPVTPIMHRQSFTVIEAAKNRTLEKFGLEFEDLFAGREEIEKKVVDGTISMETAALFADVEEKINGELARLDRELSSLDPTLAKNLATRRRKIVYHLGALRKKARSEQLRHHEDAERRIKASMTVLYPHGGLQERTVNVNSFLARYGEHFIDTVYSSIDLSDCGHRIIYL